MSSEMKLCRVVFVVLMILNLKNFVDGTPVVPCYFIFGDSLVDSGNNNALESLAKVNYEPYGIDFPKGPTGRFTNGQTLVDIIAKALGFDDFIPSFATATGPEILKGVNYASGSSGIRDESGQHQGVCISLNKQLANHKTTVSRITDILGCNTTASSQHLNKCLYSLNIGANDYINNYFMPQFYNTSQLYTPEKYAQVLVEQYSNQIRTLYNLGARKMHIVGVGLMGCTPNATAYYGTNGSLCVDKLNNAGILFNEQLRLAIEKLNTEFTDAKFVYAEQIKMTTTSGDSSPSAAESVHLTSCCEVGENGLCVPGKTPCKDRDSALFWDAFHPTEILNKMQANKTLTSLDQSEIHPMNVLQLVQLPIKC